MLAILNRNTEVLYPFLETCGSVSFPGSLWWAVIALQGREGGSVIAGGITHRDISFACLVSVPLGSAGSLYFNGAHEVDPCQAQT